MQLVRAPRHPALAPFVATLGYFADEPPHPRERILPTGNTDIMISLSDATIRQYDERGRHQYAAAVIGGPASAATIIDTSPQRAIAIVHFRLGGAAPFLPAPVYAYRDALVPLSDVWGRAGGVLRDRLLAETSPNARLEVLEHALLDHIYAPLHRDPAIEYAVEALEHGWRVCDVVAEFGTTAKPFIRRFTEQMGLSPKRFARIRRLQRTLRTLREPTDWAHVAAEHGFCDQAHLIQDFRDLTGLRPTQYRPRAADARNHVPL